MRVSIVIDSATTPELRALSSAYAGVMRSSEHPPRLWDHGTKIAVGVEGPECFSASTPKMDWADARKVMDAFTLRMSIDPNVQGES